MSLLDVVANNLTQEEDTKLHWGGALALWDPCRHKVIGVPVLEMFYRYADNSELKKFIRKGIDYVAIPHIEKLQKALTEAKCAYPSLPQLKGGLSDEQIARAILEILRLSISVDFHAFMSATHDDVRRIVWDILNEDKKAFDVIMDMSRREGWMLNPPSLQ